MTATLPVVSTSAVSLLLSCIYLLVLSAEGGGEAESVFEFALSFPLKQGTYVWTFAKVNGKYGARDPGMRTTIIKTDVDGIAGIESIAAVAENVTGNVDVVAMEDGDTLTVATNREHLANGHGVYALAFDSSKNVTSYNVEVAEAGTYVFFTQHVPSEFEADEYFLKDADGVDAEPSAEKTMSEGHSHNADGTHTHEDGDGAAFLTAASGTFFVAVAVAAQALSR